MEDIDFYIESTKQIMLYKILDMLGYAQVPFVFIATSQKVDIVDDFEKRIRSRFSNRQIMFYDDDFEKFQRCVFRLIDKKEYEHGEQKSEQGELKTVQCDPRGILTEIFHNDEIMAQLELMYDLGHGYEFLSQQVKFIISQVEFKLRQMEHEEDKGKIPNL